MATNISAPSPYADPTYLAFLRSAGATEADANAGVQLQKSRIARQLANSIAPYQEQLQQGLTNIAGNAEANGMFRSSQRLQDQQNFQTGAERQQANMQQGLVDQSQSLDFGLAQQVANLRRQQMEESMNAGQRVRLAQVQGW